ncbi:hypothetical protein [Psychromonas sp. Urea-02u-13]|uniref:hypothetical protein n=1 Tax=Psychromonas sp. Urea-02u-13 TaxID=2058326 RepID=UPI000C34A262|nr:hypothetical protein [Psychromonas sp. Urea-02u-13]PKG37309.1 hypothetical protein CXF74_19540 [Psychromonas sp. Urea-02u-13]
MGKYDWLEKRTLRSVDQLRLWTGNPRLSPEDSHLHISDFVSDLIADTSEKEHFYRLLDSISTDGFIPADPIVVWQSSENDKFYVSEGNRRVLILKLLRHPDKAPKSIRAHIRAKASLIDRDTIEKIRVAVAPSFDDCMWYINQRHAGNSLQKPWSRLQQQRWIAGLYDKYDGDLEKVMSITKSTKSQLDYTLRILQIRDLALSPEIFNQLTDVEKDSVSSHRIPMTILERWFTNSKVKEAWGVHIHVDNVEITKNRHSFFTAYLQWLRYVIRRDEPGIDVKINTRTIDSNLDAILAALPEVTSEPDEVQETGNNQTADNSNNKKEPGAVKDSTEKDANDIADALPKDAEKTIDVHYKNPARRNLVVPTCVLNVQNFKLKALFEEFKKLPMDRYKNCLASSLRVFLDLSVAQYITSEELEDKIHVEYKRAFNETTLKQRLEFLKKNKLVRKSPECKVVDALLHPANDFSLNTLNGYVHGRQVHFVDRDFLNRFWDSLFPLMSFLVDIKEV